MVTKRLTSTIETNPAMIAFLIELAELPLNDEDMQAILHYAHTLTQTNNENGGAN